MFCFLLHDEIFCWPTLVSLKASQFVSWSLISTTMPIIFDETYLLRTYWLWTSVELNSHNDPWTWECTQATIWFVPSFSLNHSIVPASPIPETNKTHVSYSIFHIIFSIFLIWITKEKKGKSNEQLKTTYNSGVTSCDRIYCFN